MEKLSRRTVIAALAAVPTAGLPAIAVAEPHPDAELLELGRKWDELADQWNTLNERDEPHSEAFKRIIKEASERAKGGSLGEEVYRAAWAQADAEFPPPSSNCEDIAVLMSPIEQKILRGEPRTLAGLAVMARIANQYCAGAGWEEEYGKQYIGWDHRVVLKLIFAVLDAAEA